MTRVHAAGVCVEIEGTTIVGGCDLVVEPGEILGLIGPN
ncbi:MAG: hemin ABC transporter ATP-binding protein, partial [Thermoleophilia bacterium]|nr:hemin ABC transporter ATP-binding protein [Thermoleophilia bacterium]